jgi:hypothetical protein
MKQIIDLVKGYGRHVTFVLVLLVFAASTVFVLVSGEHLRYPDERDYDRLARAIRHGEGYLNERGDPTAYRPPGWPTVLAGIYCFWASPLAGKLFNAVAYASTAWLLSEIVARVIPEGRVFAPLFMLLYPVGFYTASTLYPQTLGTLLLVGLLFLLSRRTYPLLFAGEAGILFGMLVLIIPAFLMVVPLVIVGMFLAERKGLSLFLMRVASLLGCMLLIVTPWTLRNAYVFDRFVPVSTNSGLNLLLGNSENAGPNTGVNVDISRYRAEIQGLNEVQSDAALRKFAVEWILHHPASAVKLYIQKVVNYFNFRNQLHVQTEQSLLKDVVMFLSYYPLLLIALLSFAWHRRDPLSATEIMLYLLYFGNAFTSAVFFTRIRFRLPFDVLLIAVDAIILGLLLQALVSHYDQENSTVNTVLKI